MMVEVPWPPSANSCWRAFKPNRGAARLILAKHGREYRKAVERLLPDVKPFHGRLRVEVTLHAPNRRRYDIDNRLKPLLDALQPRPGWAGLIADDELVDELVVRRGEIRTGGLAVVEIAEI